MERKIALFPLIILIMPMFFLPSTSTPASNHATIPSLLVPSANGAATAFNVTYAALNNTIPATVGSTPTNGTLTPSGNEYTFFANSTGNSGSGQEINYTNIFIFGNSNVCSNCARVFLDFVLTTPTGQRVDSGGFASAALYNGNVLVATIENDTSTILPRTGTSRESGACPDLTTLCYDITSQIGKHLTLAFKIGWKFTSSSAHMVSVQLGNIQLIAPAFTSAATHTMSLSGSTVNHVANVTAFNYNQTVTFTDQSTNSQVTKTWPSFLLTLYYPTGYPLSSIHIANATSNPSFTQGSKFYCKAADCSIFNVTGLPWTLAATSAALLLSITATSSNTVGTVETVVGSLALAPPAHWMPGETISLNVTNAPAIAQSGRLTVTPIHVTGRKGSLSTFSTTNGGRFSVVAPTSPLGNWTLAATFQSLYDYGTGNTTITIEHLKLVSATQPLLKVSGDNTQVGVTGTINLEGYNVLNPSSASDVGVFAVSTSTSGPNFKAYNAASSGLYVSNTTFVNGAFTTGSPLVLFVTITNPSSTPTLGNLTINHESVPGILHGVNATFAIDRLDTPPLVSASRTYEVDITFNNGQITLRVTSLKTGGQLSVTSSGKATPVFAARQQFGLFNITVASTPSSPGWVSGATVTTNSVETQPFAYVFTSTLVSQGGRILASALARTDSMGSFTANLNSSLIFQGRHIAFIVLARDSNGIVLGNQDPTGTTDAPLLCGDSTSICQPSVTAPSEAAPGQSLSIGLRLRNNSTDLTMKLHITMEVFSGTSPLSSTSKSVTISPGQTQALSFDFNAPSGLGAYTVEFNSPEYGAPIYTTTLNVVVIPSWLQIAIPALIGVAIAAVAVVYRARRPAGGVAPAEEKTRPAPGKQGPRNP